MTTRAFHIHVFEDKYTTGGRCWVARVSEWNVLAQGVTPLHALTELVALLSHLADIGSAWTWGDEWDAVMEPLATSQSGGADASFTFPESGTVTR